MENGKWKMENRPETLLPFTDHFHVAKFAERHLRLPQERFATKQPVP